MTNKPIDENKLDDLGQEIIVLTDLNISQEQINEMKMLGLAKPETVSWERWNKIQNIRLEHQHMIRLAAGGIPQWKIAQDLGYEQAHVSKILNTPEVKAEIEQEIKDIYGDDWKKTIKDRNAKAVGVVDKVLEFGNAKEAGGMAKWVLEQTVGKASQEIVEKKTSLTEVIFKIEQMNQANQLRDVGSSSGNLPSEPDPFDTIIEQVIPKGMIVGKRSSNEGQAK